MILFYLPAALTTHEHVRRGRGQGHVRRGRGTYSWGRGHECGAGAADMYAAAGATGVGAYGMATGLPGPRAVDEVEEYDEEDTLLDLPDDNFPPLPFPEADNSGKD